MILRILTASMIVCCVFVSKAQIPQFKSNATNQEKSDSFVYQNIPDQYDLVIAYTQSGYWNSNKKNCAILLFKRGVWYKGHLYSKKENDNKWSKPKIKLKVANNNKVNIILNGLPELWSMNRDSLNIHERRNKDGSIEKLSVYDLDNCRFEIFDKNKFAIIESYAPEYFFEELPENKILERFIKVKDWFVLNYKAL